jgi:CheY-like chemotaxis protein
VTEFAKSGSPHVGSSLDGVSVLLVEDNADMCLLTKLMLTRASATVTVASSADEALAKLEGARPQVLVSDINLPDQDGLSLIRRVRELPASRGGQIPAVAMSGHTDSRLKQQALAAGFHHYLTKPTSPQQLVGAVAALAAP